MLDSTDLMFRRPPSTSVQSPSHSPNTAGEISTPEFWEGGELLESHPCVGSAEEVPLNTLGFRDRISTELTVKTASNSKGESLA